ncbi:MAG: VOC family protein [Longimicrobiales bacterium]
MRNGDGPPAEASQGLRAVGISASFTASDLGSSLRFYTEGLGFEVEDRVEDGGAVRFVMLRAGEARIGIGQDDFAKGRDRVKGVGMRIWISTDQDLEALASRFRAAGFTPDFGPEPLPWGPLALGVSDPDGFHLTIAHNE